MQRTARETQMYRAMSGMIPNQLDPNMQQMLRMNGGDLNLRQKAMQNQQQNGFRGYVEGGTPHFVLSSTGILQHHN